MFYFPLIKIYQRGKNAPILTYHMWQKKKKVGTRHGIKTIFFMRISKFANSYQWEFRPRKLCTEQNMPDSTILLIVSRNIVFLAT